MLIGIDIIKSSQVTNSYCAVWAIIAVCESVSPRDIYVLLWARRKLVFDLVAMHSLAGVLHELPFGECDPVCLGEVIL